MPSKAGRWRQEARKKAVATVQAWGPPEPDLDRVGDCLAWGWGRWKTLTHPPGIAADSHFVLILSQETQLLQPALAFETFPILLTTFLIETGSTFTQERCIERESKASGDAF